MKNKKTYEIKSFQDLCNVANPENVDRLSVDLVNWLKVYVEAVSNIKSLLPQCIDKPNWNIAQGGFKWVDDGKNDLLGFEVTIRDDE